mgnify:CR=1 FL=1
MFIAHRQSRELDRMVGHVVLVVAGKGLETVEENGQEHHGEELRHLGEHSSQVHVASLDRATKTVDGSHQNIN